ncbi:ROK family transcriptional regulator [Microbacterium trichothecenolyticum]|uniref:ROK family transcriptional regulator n=1 Tax=Microbacterium ureisolvens TaxID=2781186 RepID=A0ABS7HWP4_9MICO|nr:MULTISPECIES: ROK family transcriptional regulator [Microbacterium]MBW9109220.1 ROK family transcriptional regulator [Microbacterium ureisolvens]MBW9120129.1 ROK family transcriptional regulator [Microbacterium trichothecenolyticum]
MDHDTAARTTLIRSASEAGSKVFATILTRSPISRIDIARHTGLSQAAVTKAVSPLVAAGLVDAPPVTQRDGLPGRPAAPVSIVPDAMVMLGIKINPDEVIAVATDLATNVLVSEQRALAAHDPETVADAVVDVITALEQELGDKAESIAGVGVAVSGDVDTSSGVVRASAIMGWTDVAFGAALQARLAWPVTLENDVHALTIGEHWFGVGLGTASFAIVTIGLGIGSGLHLNGQVVSGAYGVSGEIGHLPLAAPEHVCSCGRHGCVEAVASTSAIEAAVSAAHGREIGIDEAVRLAHAGDPAAEAAFREAARIIGTAIATLVNLAGPELVIIGGEGVSNFDLFEQTLRSAFEAHAFGAAARCPIVTRPHTFQDWARGAAAAAIQSLVR